MQSSAIVRCGVAALFLLGAAGAVSLAQDAAPAAATAPEKAYVGYHWDRVEEAHYTITATDETSNAQGSATVETVTDVTLRPAEKNGKETWIRMTIDRVRIKAPANNIEADSASADNPKAGPLAPIAQVLAAARDFPVRLLVSRGGRVKKVEGIEALAEAARSVMPDSPARDQLLRYMLPLTAPEVADRFASIALPLPGAKVPVGFTQEVKLPAGATELKGSLVFTRLAAGDDQKVAVVERKLVAAPQPPQTVPQGAQKFVIATESFKTDTTLEVGETDGIPFKLTSLVATEQLMRPEGADPAQNPGSKITTNRSVKTVLVSHVANANQDQAQPAEADDDEGEASAESSNGGSGTEKTATAQAAAAGSSPNR